MVEYDFALALEYAEKENGKYRIYFPQSCVLYLRGKTGSDYLEMDLVMPDGQSIGYKVPVIRMENYTCDALFQKKLLFLLPFYQQKKFYFAIFHFLLMYFLLFLSCYNYFL